MKRDIPLLVLLIAALAPISGSSQQATAKKDIFVAERGCPLVSAFPVTGSALGLKNVGQKTISSYRLACFRRATKQRTVDLVFEESVESIPPNEGLEEAGFDATPPNVCRWRRELLGVYEVKFSDGTSWKTAGSR